MRGPKRAHRLGGLGANRKPVLDHDGARRAWLWRGEFPSDDRPPRRRAQHSPADRHRSATFSPWSRREPREADPGRECVGRAWSRWPWNALTFTVSAVPDEDRGEHAEIGRKGGAKPPNVHTHTRPARDRECNTLRDVATGIELCLRGWWPLTESCPS